MIIIYLVVFFLIFLLFRLAVLVGGNGTNLSVDRSLSFGEILELR